MAARNRTHIISEKSKMTSKHLSKQEFGNRLYGLMTEKNLTQADLGRRAGIQRNAISTYINGKAYPSNINLKKLAIVLGLKPEELLPNTIKSAIDDDNAQLSMKVSPADPTKCWLRINQLVSTTLAVKIISLLQAENDNSADAK